MAPHDNSMSRQGSSSLLRILEDGVKAHTLVKSEALSAYTGFANFGALLR